MFGSVIENIVEIIFNICFPVKKKKFLITQPTKYKHNFTKHQNSKFVAKKKATKATKIRKSNQTSNHHKHQPHPKSISSIDATKRKKKKKEKENLTHTVANAHNPTVSNKQPP